MLAKFGAALQQFRLPLIAVALVRAIFVVGMIVLVAVLLAPEITSPASVPAAPPSPTAPGPAAAALVASAIIAGLAVLLAALVWFIYYLAAPTLSTLIFSALGLLASAWARTRAGGLIGAAGLRVALWVGSYVAGQFASVFFSILTLPAFALPTTPLWLERVEALDPALLVFGGALAAIAWIAVLVIVQLGVALALLYAASRRAERIA